MNRKSFILSGVLLVFIGCSAPEKDRGIKQMIASNAREDVAFAGVDFVVENGVVTLSGNCPSEKEKEEVERTVKDVSGVKDVIDQIQVAPVVLRSDHPLKQSVDSLLKDYPTVVGIVKDSVVNLQGKIDRKKAETLLKDLQTLQPKGVTNNLMMESNTK